MDWLINFRWRTTLVIFAILAVAIVIGTRYPHTLTPAPVQGAPPLTLLILGDSLSAGYRLPPGEDFGTRLETALRARGWPVSVRNASVSGDTSQGGLERVDWVLAEGDTDAVLLELGANDALRGLSPKRTRENLSAILARFDERNIPALLAGMAAPRNLGLPYTLLFDNIYPALAEKHDVVFYPFFLEDVALKSALNLSDGIHPNQQGIAVIVEGILPYVERLLARAQANEPPANLLLWQTTTACETRSERAERRKITRLVVIAGFGRMTNSRR